MTFFRKLIEKEVARQGVSRLVELDPNKNYILVVPLSVSDESIKEGLRSLDGTVNLMVIKADSVSLLSLV